MKRIIYDVPKWHIYLHREERQMPALTRDSTDPQWLLQDELFERLYSGEPKKIEIEEGKAGHEKAGWAEKLHKMCDDIPDFARLGNECRGDSGAAAMATESLINTLQPHITEEKVAQSNPFNTRNAIRQGCMKASEQVEEIREAAEGLEQLKLRPSSGAGGGVQPNVDDNYDERGNPILFGLGEGKGSVKLGSHDGMPMKSLAARLRRDRKLREIALLAGRFKRIAQNKQRQKSKHDRDEISDITQGDDIGRLLPSELIKLTHPVLRRLILRDIMERQAMQYELKGTEPLGKGPIVVCLDKSGSMQGAPDIWASAIAMALLDIATRQKRPFALVNFDSEVKYEAIVFPGEAMPEEGLFEFSGGGTDIDVAIGRALEIVETHPGKLKHADVILVGDGDSTPYKAEELRAKAKALGVTVFGIGVGVDPKVFSPWATVLHAVKDIHNVDEHTADTLFTI